MYEVTKKNTELHDSILFIIFNSAPNFFDSRRVCRNDKFVANF